MGVTLQQLNKSKFTGPLASNFGLKTWSRKIDQIQNTRKHKRDQMGKRVQIVLESCKQLFCFSTLIWKLWVEKQNSCSQRKVSFATTCARYVSPCSTFPSKLGQSIDASFVRILGCPGEQRGFSIILSPTDGWWPRGFLKASLGSLQPEQANFSS